MSVADTTRKDLKGEAWLEAASLQRLFDALETRGAARVAGGAVRDGLLGRPVADVDVATTLAPDEVIDTLKEHGIKTFPTGLEHGTITAVAGEAEADVYQVTTLRVDVETDGRRAKVAFTDDWAADAGRRDFTMNALYCDRDGSLFDPLGGYADLVRRAVRFAGDAGQRIEEDYLRILRFFRFNAVFGGDAFDAEGLLACEQRRSGLDALSRERIHQELFKLLAAPGALATVKVMGDRGIIEHIVPGPCDIARFERTCSIEEELQRGPDALLRLASLALRDRYDASRLRDGLKLANSQADRLEALTGDRPALSPDLPEASVKEALYAMGTPAFEDAALYDWSGSDARENDRRWSRMLALPQSWTPPKFPLRGADLTKRGVAPGPRVGAILREVEAWWVTAGFPADETSLLAYLETAIADCDKAQ